MWIIWIMAKSALFLEEVSFLSQQIMLRMFRPCLNLTHCFTTLEYLQVTFAIDQGTIKYRRRRNGTEREGNMYCTPSSAQVETTVVPICFGNKLDDKGKKTGDIHIVHYGALKEEATTKSVDVSGMTKEDDLYETIAEMKTEIRNLTSLLKQYAPHAPQAQSPPRYGYGNALKGGKRRPKNRDEESVIWV